MALSKEEVAMYAYITGRVLPKGTTRRAFNLAVAGAIRAAQLVAPVAARGVATAVPAIGTAAAAAPITTGAALGLGALATPPGQELLEMARERGRQDRIDFDEMLATGRAFVESPTGRGQIRTKAKKTVSKYNKAVKAGMKAVKQSKFAGKKGVINNPKQVFGTVNKVVSAVNKKKKVIPKGIRGTIARAARKVLK
jgi:hypothetical protein